MMNVINFVCMENTFTVYFSMFELICVGIYQYTCLAVRIEVGTEFREVYIHVLQLTKYIFALKGV